MSTGNSHRRYRIIKASYRLQQKIGMGIVDGETVQASQTVIDENDVDFAPLGLEILERLKQGLVQINKLSLHMQDKNTKLMLIAPIMELKANAAIFHYTLVGHMANIILGFLEHLERIDNDAQDIVRAYHDILHMLLVNGVSGDGGEHKETLIKELREACNRYLQKNTLKNNV